MCQNSTRKTELERTARLIAAHKMGLVKDVYGEGLPDDLWRQAIPAAERELAAGQQRTVGKSPVLGMGYGKGK